ncbi:MAG: tetratricopeptide repeat protein [Nostoc sp. LLA-1]|nr:tetratricopeptide repeat protein [Cyanocohniella sp. LLY]
MQVLRCFPKQEIINLSVSLGRGGEACIYAVPSSGDLVAKVYHKPTDAHAHKLRAMLANPPENPTASLGHISIAWPQDLLRATDASHGIIGFLMPRIRGMRPIIDFYNPSTRRQHCPLFNYQYLLRTARNLAAAFAALHNSGYCVGDVNESNILVSDTALVTLVDTDSFQVRDPDNNDLVYRCPVGKPEFTPPELQNKTFAQHDREIVHDSFGLAVLVFQLLMEGTHPFSGIFQGIPEPPPYEARIAAGHFTYSQKRQVPYRPTPIAPAWEVLHPKLQELFLRCFEDGYNDPQLRPNAQTWLSALAEAEDSLITCTVNPQHRYNNHLESCPWCERASRLGGRDPFPSSRAVENKEHLRPRSIPKRRYAQRPRSPQPVMPLYPVNSWQPVANPSYSSYHVQKKAKVYPAVLCLLGVGVLGYLDVMVKFTRPYVSQNAYTQQALMARPTPDKETLSFADYYQQGHAAYQIRDYEQAVENFSQAIKQEPTSARAYVNRGNARYNLKDYEGALIDYNQALKINPQEVKAFVNRGNARYMLAEFSHDPDREYNLAIADFDQALRINSQETEAFLRRGIVRSQMARYSSESLRDYKQAIIDFTQAIRLNVSNAEAYFQRGDVRYKMAQFSSDFIQDYQQAIADFNQALKINDKLAKVYLKRGMIRYELTQYSGQESDPNNLKAIEDLQAAAKFSLEQEDTEIYQQALSSICVIIESQCSAFLQSSAMWQYTNTN